MRQFENYSFEENNLINWHDALQNMKELCIVNHIKPHHFVEIFEMGLEQIFKKPQQKTKLYGDKKR